MKSYDDETLVSQVLQTAKSCPPKTLSGKALIQDLQDDDLSDQNAKKLIQLYVRYGETNDKFFEGLPAVGDPFAVSTVPPRLEELSEILLRELYRATFDPKEVGKMKLIFQTYNIRGKYDSMSECRLAFSTIRTAIHKKLKSHCETSILLQTHLEALLNNDSLVGSRIFDSAMKKALQNLLERVKQEIVATSQRVLAKENQEFHIAVMGASRDPDSGMCRLITHARMPIASRTVTVNFANFCEIRNEDDHKVVFEQFPYYDMVLVVLDGRIQLRTNLLSLKSFLNFVNSKSTHAKWYVLLGMICH